MMLVLRRTDRGWALSWKHKLKYISTGTQQGLLAWDTQEQSQDWGSTVMQGG